MIRNLGAKVAAFMITVGLCLTAVMFGRYLTAVVSLTVIRCELALLAVACLVFVALYLRSRWTDTPIGRHIMLWALLGAADAFALFALGMGARLPLWVFVALFGAQDVVAVWRIMIVIRAQRESTEG